MTDSKRDAILTAAREVFRESGFTGATLVRIAVAAGLSYSELVEQFPDKELLLRAVLAQRDDDEDARSDFDAITDPQAALAAVVDLVEYNAAHRGMVELFTVLVGESVVPSSPGHDFFRERYARRVDSFRRTYQRGADAGVLDPEWTPDAAAVELTALLDGLQIQWLLSDGAIDMAALVRAHLSRQIVSPTAAADAADAAGE
ncbi:MAG: TetR/AcrR family transcriptional regulator [Microbacteriaceae bacterium]|nr:TetR/AcrR family transcriptional regulator [Microbacteriaceae bacterium]MCL2794876.1 TetR/AcrR family transcriptional regulator [Microbacteriaceae bacterium]